MQIWALKTCNQDIWKIIIASSFKHGQLTDDDETMSRLPGENFKKKLSYFLSYCPLQMMALTTCSQDISKTITASSLKPCQLTEGND